MANNNILKAAIADYVKNRTGLETIDGDGLQQSLLAMINSLGAGYQYAGVAVLTPTPTNPGTPDQNVFYIAAESGTYANFSGIVIGENELAILKWNGAWNKQVTGGASADYVLSLFEKNNGAITNQSQLDEYVDVDNRKTGIVSFQCVNGAIFSNIPRLNYEEGAILITLRSNNQSFTSLDRQFLITHNSISSRGYFNGQWQNWQISDLKEIKYFFKNNGLSTFDVDSLHTGVFSFVSTSTPNGLPNVDYSVGGLIITTRASESAWTNQDRQFLITESSLWERVYFNGFTQWFGGEMSRIKETTTTVPDIDNLQSGINSFVSLNVPTGFPNLDYTQGGLIITVRQKPVQLTDNDHQYIFTQNGVYTRAYFNGVWQAWFGTTFTQNAGRIVECGVGKEYTTLRSAIAAAIQTNGTKVIVYPGVYDLTKEFATELQNHSGSGILLTNDVHVVFMPGAYVTCLVDVSNEWAYTYFEPFRVNSGNFTLENANINCKNTRYNVHDELAGSDAQYIHRYINCIMEHYDENPIAYYTQCIGGGLGSNGYIEVIGGKYKSTSLYYQTEHYTSPDDMQMPITYHNGNNAACDCKIVIRDVYLADKGYLRFGNYGPSTILTPVFVSGCRMYKPVFLMNETWLPSQVQNFEIISFNNEIVNP